MICLAQVRDVYSADEVGEKYANVVMLLAPLIAPVIGAVLMQFGWQAIFVFLTVYAVIFLLLLLTLIPETRVGPRRKLSPTSLFSGYINVVKHRVNGRLTPIRYTLYNAFSIGIFMCFLTNASFIYIQRFGLNEFQFAAAFTANSALLIVGNRLAVAMMERMDPHQLLRRINTGQCVLIAIAIVALLLGYNGFWTVFGFLLLIVSTHGAINPTAAGVFISYFDELSGSAASLDTTLRFFIGPMIGALAAILADGSLLPIFFTMLAATLIARIILNSIQSLA